jgi:hypothetical protein
MTFKWSELPALHCRRDQELLPKNFSLRQHLRSDVPELGSPLATLDRRERAHKQDRRHRG